MSLQGKTVFISGSTRGIGHAIAVGCAADGAEVIVHGRTEPAVDAAIDRIRAAVPGASISGCAADLAVSVEVSGLLDRLRDLGVDVLINNAGIFDVADFTTINDDEWSRYLTVNLMAGVRLSRALLGGMLTRNWGRIIFIGTESAVDVPADMIHYGTTKAAALALSNGLAKLTKGTAVTVNTVLGGPTYSDGVSARIEEIAAEREISTEQLKSGLVRPTSLLGRFIDPEEIADVVVFLAGRRSSAINGAAVRVDGGVLTTLT
ncbi:MULTISPECIES: SDR family NAD(P)-dependent oxidoreductase [Brevibacterium]|jgi:NAD(P)-dependent dehydrogenase (short-subunit alcohol dehydrogenase family)|uniref:SDR family NAD(P)-dependent oxidoreductase n=1 Tax=Brevibacterium TaxID=1696 RepID=UPI001BA63291|nr:SDR family oxidoreductase [Brevibacterium sp. W7.2]